MKLFCFTLNQQKNPFQKSRCPKKAATEVPWSQGERADPAREHLDALREDFERGILKREALERILRDKLDKDFVKELLDKIKGRAVGANGEIKWRRANQMLAQHTHKMLGGNTVVGIPARQQVRVLQEIIFGKESDEVDGKFDSKTSKKLTDYVKG